MSNFLLTGPPRSGKTTVIRRVTDRLESQSYRVGGVYCPELRSEGDRVGFEITDVMTSDARVMAHVDREEGPQIGKYRVNVAAVDAVCSVAFPRAFEEADLLVVDEIAPMELYSKAFVRAVRRGLDGDIPVVAAVKYGSTEGFIGEVKNHDGTELFEVTEDTRDDLPARLAGRLSGVL